MFSFKDVSRDNQEKFYHGFMLGLTASLIETHEIDSNKESGLGIYDIAIAPKDKTQNGVILEFKATENEKDLEKEVRC